MVRSSTVVSPEGELKDVSNRPKRENVVYIKKNFGIVKEKKEKKK